MFINDPEVGRLDGRHREGDCEMYDRARLIELFHQRALRFGDFTLASGKKSSYYLDGKQITLHSEGLKLLSEGLLDLLEGIEFDAFGGMSLGADPIVGGVLTAAAARGKELAGFLVRKESKGHGTQKYLEGPVTPGMRVVIVDDVVTTGGSALLSVDRSIDFGLNVIQVVGVVDRKEGGAANFAARQLPFKSLLSIEDFGIKPPVVG